MLDIGWSEILLIAIVAVVVIGPKELPAALRTVGAMLTRLRRMAGEFQGQFQQAMKEADLADVTKEISEIRHTVSSMKGGMGLSPAAYLKNEIGGSLTGPVLPTAAAAAAAPAAAATAAEAMVDTTDTVAAEAPPTVEAIEAMSGAAPAAPAPPAAAPAPPAAPDIFIPSAFAPMAEFTKS